MVNDIDTHSTDPNRKHASLSNAIWAIRFLFLLNGFICATWATRIPAVQSLYQLSHAGLGMALMIIALGAVIAMPITGWLCNRFGTIRIIKFGLLVYVIALPITIVMPHVWILCTMLIVFGLGHGMLDVAMNVRAVEVEQQNKLPVNSSIHAFWSLGGLLGAMIGALVASQGLAAGFHFLLVSILACLTSPFILNRMATVQDSLTHKQQTSGVPGEGSIQQAVESPNVSNNNTAASGKGRLATAHPALAVGALGVMAFSVMVGEGAMADWSAVMMRNVVGASEGIAAIGFAAFATAMAVGRLSGDMMTKKLGPKNMVRVSSLLALSGLILVVSVPNTAIALTGFAMIGAGFATIVPIVFTACGQISNVSASSALSSVSTIGYFGFLLGPPVIGFAAEAFGLRMAIASLILTTSTTFFLASILTGRKAESHDVEPEQQSPFINIDPEFGECVLSPTAASRQSA